MVKTQMTPYKRVMTALRGESPDKVPFTVYETHMPRSSVERELRNRGLCIVKRITSYRSRTPNVKIESHHYKDNSLRSFIRTVYTTPYGQLSTLDEDRGFTKWRLEHMFKTPEDYKSLLFFIKDTVIEPDYDTAARIVSDLGEDFVVRDQIPLEPLQTIMRYMGTEKFCYEWLDNRDEVLKLYQALLEVNRKVYPVIAGGPLEFANYGGNVAPQIIGVENFVKYYIPNYNEAAEILHKSGKLVGCHLDADNSLIMKEIAGTQLDYIEAYDPGISPSVKEARKAWPGKILWLNWPSAWHWEAPGTVRARTVDLIKEAAPGNGFIIGITEDVPEECLERNYTAIMDGIEDHLHMHKTGT